MAKSVIALYDSLDTAQQVVRDLDSAGFDRSDISLVANDANGDAARYGVGDDGDMSAVGEGATAGAVGGGVLGLLAGLGALAIPGIGPVVAAGPLMAALAGAGIGAATGGLLGGLVDMGIPDDDAHAYAEGVRRGGTLVSARVDDDRADEAVSIMNRYGPVDIERSAGTWRQSGWSGFSQDSEPYGATQINRSQDFHRYETTQGSNLGTTSTRTDTTRTDYDRSSTGLSTDQAGLRDSEGEIRLAVTEEELRIGKREVEQGGVRVETRVTDTPVEEQVTLREEHVTVDRRPVDRAVTAADMDAMRSGTLEVRTTAEEVVVDKQARVVEEVVVRKDVDTRTETISDSVRRTDVDVQEVAGSGRTSDTDWETYSTRFRSHFDTNYANSGYTYQDYEPAYRYGYDLSNDARYRGREWSDIETDVQRDWESRNPNTWDRFKDTVRDTWNDVRNR